MPEQPVRDELDQGVAFGPGCQPSASAPDGSSQSDTPNAEFLRQLEAAFRLLGYHEMGWEGSFLTAYIADGFRDHAQAIEARRAAAAKTDAVVDESAVAASDAPKSNPKGDHPCPAM